jgi:hypothetical protein
MRHADLLGRVDLFLPVGLTLCRGLVGEPMVRPRTLVTQPWRRRSSANHQRISCCDITPGGGL